MKLVKKSPVHQAKTLLNDLKLQIHSNYHMSENKRERNQSPKTKQSQLHQYAKSSSNIQFTMMPKVASTTSFLSDAVHNQTLDLLLHRNQVLEALVRDKHEHQSQFNLET